MSAVTYLHVVPGNVLSDACMTLPYRAVIIAEAEVSADWQKSASEWLVRSGCLYSMAWGIACSSWDDSVDDANIAQFNFESIPEDKFVMTTWHDAEPLSEVFWFCKHAASHPSVEPPDVLLLHVSRSPNENEILELYAAA